MRLFNWHVDYWGANTQQVEETWSLLNTYFSSQCTAVHQRQTKALLDVGGAPGFAIS